MTSDTLEVLRYLSETIGARPAGSPAEATAARYLADELSRRGWHPQVNAFDYRGWLGDDASLGLAETVAHGRPLPYTFPTPAEGIAGHVVAGGTAAPIPGRLDCRRFYIEREDGQRVGRVLVGPFADARPMPNARATDSMPTILLGTQHLDCLNRAASNGIDAVLRTESREMLAVGRNIVADLPPAPDGRQILIVAHYDTVDNAPGANDNGSGVAAAIAVFAHAARLGLPIRLLLTTAEELMFRGAEAYLVSLQEEGRDGEIAACLCLDMLGVGERLDLRSPKSGWWETIARKLGGSLSTAPEMASSDHWVFHLAGILSAQITRVVDPDYHSPLDTISRIDRANLEDGIRQACSLLELAAEELPPKRGRGT